MHLKTSSLQILYPVLPACSIQSRSMSSDAFFPAAPASFLASSCGIAVHAHIPIEESWNLEAKGPKAKIIKTLQEAWNLEAKGPIAKIKSLEIELGSHHSSLPRSLACELHRKLCCAPASFLLPILSSLLVTMTLSQLSPRNVCPAPTLGLRSIRFS